MNEFIFQENPVLFPVRLAHRLDGNAGLPGNGGLRFPIERGALLVQTSRQSSQVARRKALSCRANLVVFGVKHRCFP